MSYVIDRRLNPRNKSAVNRQRFLHRYRKHIRKAVNEAVSRRSITDVERGEEITIPADDVTEPIFHHGAGGERTIVHPGNREFVAGDRIPRPGGGGGGGASSPSNQGEGVDDFVFQLTQEEFLEFMFDGLELPNLIKRQLVGNESFERRRAGYTNEGVPAKLDVLRSFRAAKARRIAVSSGARRRIDELRAMIERARDGKPRPEDLPQDEAQDELAALRARVEAVPFLDKYDLRYHLDVKHPRPTSQAVMFCLMDVSGSMDQQIKDLAKRFFLLLYLFLKRNYERTDLVFIRHHTTAKEVDEEEFFYSRETGGTVVSSALRLMGEVVRARYPVSDWNIYAAQASDGDNWHDDSPICRRLLAERILPLTQYYTYVEITRRDHQTLWYEYEQLLERFADRFAMRQITDVSDIYPVFRDLFERKAA